MTSTLFLGIDGGGSRCRARLESAEGEVLGRGFAGPASMRFGFDTVRDAIMTVTRQALDEARLDDAALARTYAGIGLAGTGHKGARQTLEAWKHPFAGAWFEGDGYLALLGAFGGGEGGVVICGTGSIGISFQGRTVRIGGYGFPVSDEGSGADLGLNALRHALRTLDGRAEPSAFSKDVLARFNADPTAVADWMENATATDYATLAPIVVRCAEDGDAAAVRLMQEAAAHITGLVQALYRRRAPKVALIGGLAQAVRAFMAPDIAARLVEPAADAMAGGILLAKAEVRAAEPRPAPRA
ncbi:MAG: hypothetical protein JNJ73_09035 [Hyphomonadaceae bacterium]|nr:hypothetical protein [Hyphomonadaceae bacterium]